MSEETKCIKLNKNSKTNHANIKVLVTTACGIVFLLVLYMALMKRCSSKAVPVTTGLSRIMCYIVAGISTLVAITGIVLVLISLMYPGSTFDLITPFKEPVETE